MGDVLYLPMFKLNDRAKEYQNASPTSSLLYGGQVGSPTPPPPPMPATISSLDENNNPNAGSCGGFIGKPLDLSSSKQLLNARSVFDIAAAAAALNATAGVDTSMNTSGIMDDEDNSMETGGENVGASNMPLDLSIKTEKINNKRVVNTDR